MAVPKISFMLAIIRFLSCNPLPVAKTLAEQLVRHRTALGMSQKEAALKIGVDAATLARWERAEREPTGGFVRQVQRFLGDEVREHNQRRAS